MAWGFLSSFDLQNNLHATEDIDFLLEFLRLIVDKRLVICTKSRAWHHYTPIGRLDFARKQQRKFANL